MREIKFRVWDKVSRKMLVAGDSNLPDLTCNGCPVEPHTRKNFSMEMDLMQYTGLKDKNGLTEVYEGDIIDENGIVKGNIYESPQIYKEGIDCLIEGMGTEAWRNTESIAMGRGCIYSK